MKKIPFVEDSLKIYSKTPEGLPLWKTKNLNLSYENILENIFVLSIDIARYFNMRHNNLVNQNIRKLQKEKQLPERLLNFKQPYISGNSTKLFHIVYALTRHQTYHLIMDFAGTKARNKKHDIVRRLESIETDVLKGLYLEAKQKASSWDGVQLLKEFGFNYSVDNNVAIKKDITKFLKIPESTLNNFLRKHSDEIKPIRLDYATIHSLGLKARRLNGYQEKDVAKIAFGMDTEIGIKLKKRMFGQLGTFTKPEVKEEVQWREVLSKVFQGFDLRYNHPIGKYRVDFFVPTMELCLECNGYNCHKYYDQKEEEKREKVILQKYSLVRFHHKISLETLFNGILQAKKGKVIKLYDIEDLCDKLHLSLN